MFARKKRVGIPGVVIALLVIVPSSALAAWLWIWPFWSGDPATGTGHVTGVKINSPHSYEYNEFRVAVQLSDGSAHYAGGRCEHNLNDWQMELINLAAANGTPVQMTGSQGPGGRNCITSVIMRP